MAYPTQALTTQGVVVQRGDGGSPEVFTAIGEITNFNGPTGATPTIDASTLESLAREYRLGLADFGEFSFTLRFVPANTQHTALYNDFKNRTQGRNFKVLLTDTPTSTLSFTGLVSGFAISGENDGLIEAQVTIKITGLPTLA
jgi:hypothetical protein